MNNIKYDKPFKTYDELISIMESRNIAVPDHEFARRVLNSLSYYTLINGYKDTFLSVPGTDIFVPGTCFNDLYTLHLIDTNLNSIILKYILYIEKYLKSRIAYIVAEQYGVYTDPGDLSNNNPDDYLCRQYYSPSASGRNNVLYKIKNTLTQQKISKSVQHYLETKNHIPPWILVTSLTFGLMIKWYNILNVADKERICNDFLPTPDLSVSDKKEFVFVALKLLREYRNKIAHSSRTFNTEELPVLPKRQLLLLSSGILTKEEYNRGFGKSDLYGVILSCVILIDDNYILTDFLSDLIYTLKKYQSLRLAGKDIFAILGLPNDIVSKLSYLINSKFSAT